MDEQIDPSEFRNVLGHFPTGVVVVTTLDASREPQGMTIGSFASVSLDPPLVAFMAKRTSKTAELVRRSELFAVNVLGADQEDLCRAMAASEADRFRTVDWTPGGRGVPLLAGCTAWVECSVAAVHAAGDHDIVIGRVHRLGVHRSSPPLVFFRGGYGRFHAESLVGGAGVASIEQLRYADLARREMELISAELGVECLASATVGAETTVMASAVPPHRREVPSRIGLRIPFVAPFSPVLAAELDDAALGQWLRLLDPAGDADLARQLRGSLDTVRERGWSLTLRYPGRTELESAVTHAATGAARPDVARLLTDALPYFEPPVAPAARYSVLTLSAPVRLDAQLLLYLTVYGLPRAVDGATVLAHAERLTTGAARVAELIGRTG